MRNTVSFIVILMSCIAGATNAQADRGPIHETEHAAAATPKIAEKKSVDLVNYLKDPTQAQVTQSTTSHRIKVTSSERDTYKIGLAKNDSYIGVTGELYCSQFIEKDVTTTDAAPSASDLSDVKNLSNKLKSRISFTLYFNPPQELFDNKITSLTDCENKAAQKAGATKNNLDCIDSLHVTIDNKKSIYANFSDSDSDKVIAKTDAYDQLQHFGSCVKSDQEIVDGLGKIAQGLPEDEKSSINKLIDKYNADIIKTKSEDALAAFNKTLSTLNDHAESMDDDLTVASIISDANKVGDELAALAKDVDKSDALDDATKEELIKKIHVQADTLRDRVNIASNGKKMRKDPTKFAAEEHDLLVQMSKYPRLNKDTAKADVDAAKSLAPDGDLYYSYIFERNPKAKVMQTLLKRNKSAYLAASTYHCAPPVINDDDETSDDDQSTKRTKHRSLDFTQCGKINKDIVDTNAKLGFLDLTGANNITASNLPASTSIGDTVLQKLDQQQALVAPIANPQLTAANTATKYIRGLPVAVPKSQYFEYNNITAFKAPASSNAGSANQYMFQTVSNT